MKRNMFTSGVVTKLRRDILARLMATENLRIEYSKVETASFDTKNRVLTLPIWADISRDVHDLLIGHEVGHAIDTPRDTEEIMKKFIEELDPNNPRGVHSFVNVVEDARIERKIKLRYPGLRRNFNNGYREFVDMDFFGIEGKDVNSLPFIDRINLDAKIGQHIHCKFNTKEQALLQEVYTTDTFEEVLEVVRKIYEYSKDQMLQCPMSSPDQQGKKKAKITIKGGKGQSGQGEAIDLSEYEEVEIEIDESALEDEGEDGEENGAGSEGKEGEEGKSEGEGDKEADVNPKIKITKAPMSNKKPTYNSAGGSAEATTVRVRMTSQTYDYFEAKKKDLIEKTPNDNPLYVNVPRKINAKRYLEDFPYFMNTVKNYLKPSDQDFANKFKNEINPTIQAMVKDFEMKKAADLHSRAAESKTGVINTNKLHTYKFNEDIFRRMTSIPKGKNHGLMMFIDWSGSMTESMTATIEQLLILTTFCKKIQVPFEVYAFISGQPANPREQQVYEEGDLMIPDFRLANLLSSRMKSIDYTNAYAAMVRIKNCFDKNNRGTTEADLPARYSLGGTPLNSSIFAAMTLADQFGLKNSLQINNVVFLTDGDSEWCRSYMRNGTHADFGYNQKHIIIRDSLTRAEFYCADNGYGVTEGLLNVLRERTYANVLGFFLLRADKSTFKTILDYKIHNNKISIDNAFRDFQEKKCFATPGAGYDKFFLIPDGNSLQVSSGKKDKLDSINSKMSTAAMAKEFIEINRKMTVNRVLVNRFVETIAKSM